MKNTTNKSFNSPNIDNYFIYNYVNGNWNNGNLVKGNKIELHVLSNVFHYGQALFEGLRAKILNNKTFLLFNYKKNAERMRQGCKRLLMPLISDEMFLNSIKNVIKNNMNLFNNSDKSDIYIRPFIIGCGAQLGMQPAPQFKFICTAMNVGKYYTKSLNAIVVTDYNRACENGVGNIKMAGNYARSLLPSLIYKNKNYDICLYLDSKENKYIEEFSTSNFLAFDKDDILIIPQSNTILKGITSQVIIQLAEDLGFKTKYKKILFDEIINFKEIACCGTAAKLCHIKSITKDKIKYNNFEFNNFKKILDLFNKIQNGKSEKEYKWIHKINI